MRESYLLSVILPVFNAEKYLRIAIESILAQTYTNFELIIINDGSKDSSEKIIKSFQDKRIIYYYQKNKGVSASRNRAISVAKGDFIVMHDADDVSVPDRFKKQLEYLSKHPAVGFLGTNIDVIDENNKYKFSVSLLTHPDDLKLAEVFSNQFAQGSVMVRRHVLKKSGLYNEKMKYSEDADLWRRLHRYTDAANLKEPLYQYRIHEEGASQNTNKIRLSALNTARREFKYLLNHRESYKLLSLHPFSMKGGVLEYFKRKGSVYRCFSHMCLYASQNRKMALYVLLLAIVLSPFNKQNYLQLKWLFAKNVDININNYEFF